MSHSVLDFDDFDNDWKTIEVPLQENPIKSAKLKITGVVKVSLSWTPHTMMVQMDGNNADSSSVGGGRRSSFSSNGSGRNLNAIGALGDDDGEHSKSLEMDDDELEDLCDEGLSDDEQVRRKLQRSNTQQSL